MRQTVKPLETHLTLPAEFLDADPTVNDSSAALQFDRTVGDTLVRDGKLIWVNTPMGAWSSDPADLQEAVTCHADALRLTSVQSKGKRRVLDYGGQVSLTRSLLVKLPDVLPRQDGWWLSKVASDGAKLLCPNGIYDFRTDTLGPFDPSIVCSASIPWDWPEHFNEADMDYLDKVLYQDPFDDLRIGEIEKHYHMRGVIGDFRMKKVLVALGPPNSGKGVKVALLQAALGRGLVGSFNGNDLLMRQNVDSDLDLSFVGRVANGRIVVSSEIKFNKNAAIDGNKLKSISGGGDVLECRSKFERSTFVVPTCLFMLFANDMPKIAPADEAVLSRLVVVQPSYSFVANPDPRKSEKQADPLLKDKVNTPEMAIAFLGLMLRMSLEWQAADFAEPVLPESMKLQPPSCAQRTTCSRCSPRNSR